jgi:hypothetical protein
MTKNTPTGANREVRPAAHTRTREEQELDDAQEKERLKTAFFAALDRTGLNLKQIAERCELESANRLYNLKNGHSEMLSVLTYVTVARHLNLPISELLGMPNPVSAAPASLRASAAVKIAAERTARSFGYVRTAVERFYPQYIAPDRPPFDPAGQLDLLAAFLRIDCGLEAVAQDVSELLKQLRVVVPDLPSFPPL